jgi:hypothetical protein
VSRRAGRRPVSAGPRVGAALAGLLLCAALAGCDVAPGARPTAGATGTPAATGVGLPGTDRPSTGPAPSGTGRPADPVAYRTGPPPSGPPATLAGSAPGGAGGWVARLWFGGVQIGRDRNRLVVAYTSVDLNSDGTRMVAHAKLAVFRCVRREYAGSPNFDGCTGRRVEYADVATPQLTFRTTDADAFTVTGAFPTYSYDGADRGPGLPAQWTGRTFTVQVTCAPDPDPACHPGRPGRSSRSASVRLGPGTAGRAGLDFGYLNRLTR